MHLTGCHPSTAPWRCEAMDAPCCWCWCCSSCSCSCSSCFVFVLGDASLWYHLLTHTVEKRD